MTASHWLDAVAITSTWNPLVSASMSEWSMDGLEIISIRVKMSSTESNVWWCHVKPLADPSWCLGVQGSRITYGQFCNSLNSVRPSSCAKSILHCSFLNTIMTTPQAGWSITVLLWMVVMLEKPFCDLYYLQIKSIMWKIRFENDTDVCGWFDVA